MTKSVQVFPQAPMTSSELGDYKINKIALKI